MALHDKVIGHYLNIKHYQYVGVITGAELLDFVKNKEDFSMVGGFFKPLTKPGLGVEIDEAKVIEFSKNAPDWRNPLWRHEDNSVAEW